MAKGASYAERIREKAKVEGDCWLWVGATAAGGKYGAFRYGGRSMPAQRASWLAFNPDQDPQTLQGMKVVQMCGNTLCVAPEHLEVKVDTRLLPDEERFFSFVDKDGPKGCWLWTGATTKGYGVFTIAGSKGRIQQAHRWLYEHLNGPVADGLDLDHLCRVRACVNPEHLEPVTRLENLRRGDTITGANAAKTHCHKGHPLSGKNLRVNTRKDGRTYRSCKACSTETAEEWYARMGREYHRLKKREQRGTT